VKGLQDRIRFHCALAREFAGWVLADGRFEICAPHPFSTVCFRALHGESGEGQDRFNERVLAEVNARGPVFLSHTMLRGRIVLRLTVGNLRTDREHVATAWNLIREAVGRVAQ
jgi:aromatic-L-amino-acid decarboxylase